MTSSCIEKLCRPYSSCKQNTYFTYSACEMQMFYQTTTDLHTFSMKCKCFTRQQLIYILYLWNANVLQDNSYFTYLIYEIQMFYKTSLSTYTTMYNLVWLENVNSPFCVMLNLLRPRQKCPPFCRHFQIHFLEWKFLYILIQVSLKFVPNGPNDDNPALVLVQLNDISLHNLLYPCIG